MTALVIVAAVADWFSGRVLGEAALLAVAAVVLGYVVWRLWPKPFAAQLFGVLAATAFLGGMAYIGSKGAALAIVLLVAIGAIMAFTGML